jgi:hypothetical protein
MGTRTVGKATAQGRPAPVPGRRQLLGAVAMVAIGSFMPWLDTAVGSVSGVRGAGLWTFYAAMLGLAGALVPLRTLALAQGAVLSIVAVVLPVWQVVHVLNLVGTGGWTPGPGLVLVFGGGVLAGVATRRMFSHEWPAR